MQAFQFHKLFRLRFFSSFFWGPSSTYPVFCKRRAQGPQAKIFNAGFLFGLAVQRNPIDRIGLWLIKTARCNMKLSDLSRTNRFSVYGASLRAPFSELFSGPRTFSTTLTLSFWMVYMDVDGRARALCDARAFARLCAPRASVWLCAPLRAFARLCAPLRDSARLSARLTAEARNESNWVQAIAGCNFFHCQVTCQQIRKVMERRHDAAQVEAGVCFWLVVARRCSLSKETWYMS